MDLRIGACGWNYIPVKMNKLRAYARLFDIVEVDNTFYSIPSIDTVSRWRNTVPRDFIFTLMMPREISHVEKFMPSEKVYRILEELYRVYKILNAEMVVVQLPYGSRPVKNYVSRLNNFLEYVNNLFPVGLQTRGPYWKSVKAKNVLRELLERNDVTHVFDMSYEKPVYHNDIVYTRIYGKGVHNKWVLDDKEVIYIAKESRRMARSNKVRVMGHGVRMYDDALRIKEYIRSEKLLPIYPVPGLPAVRQAIMEKPVFPARKETLLKEHGWKVVDITDDRRVRLSELLKGISDRVYYSVDDVLREIRL